MRSLIIVVLLLAFGCALRKPAQLPPPRPAGEWITMRVHEDWYGAAMCGSRPTSWTNDETPESDRGWVKVHEAEHRRLMATFTDCRAFREWFDKSLENRIEMEARAYCAGALWELEKGRFDTLDGAMWKHATTMGAYFGISTADAFEEIEGYCEPEDGSTPRSP